MQHLFQSKPASLVLNDLISYDNIVTKKVIQSLQGALLYSAHSFHNLTEAKLFSDVVLIFS